VSSLILDSTGLVKQPKDPYWDAPLTRREAQIAINQISENEMALTNRSDTTSIVLNYLCEKLNVTRAELDVFVEKKKAEAVALQEAQQRAAKAAEAANEQSNG
jgi:hypothetical protein